MNYRKIFWGVILVTIGVLFFLKNLDILYFSWRSVFRLWPLLLVLWGISIIPIRDGIKLLLSFAAVIVTIFLVRQYDPGHRYDFRWSDREWGPRHEREWGDRGDQRDDSVYSWSDQVITEPWDTAISSALLKLDAAAGEFSIGGTTTNLLEFSREGDFADYNLTSRKIGESRVLELRMREGRIKGDVHNEASISLNPDPVWDFDLDIGAADIQMDFTAFKTESIKIDGGAAAIKIKIGSLHPKTDIDIDAGASSIIIRVPEEAGCRIHSETFLVDKDFQGFEKSSTGRFSTPGYEDASRKINIRVDAAIASFKVIRYKEGNETTE